MNGWNSSCDSTRGRKTCALYAAPAAAKVSGPDVTASSSSSSAHGVTGGQPWADRKRALLLLLVLLLGRRPWMRRRYPPEACSPVRAGEGYSWPVCRTPPSAAGRWAGSTTTRQRLRCDACATNTHTHNARCAQGLSITSRQGRPTITAPKVRRRGEATSSRGAATVPNARWGPNVKGRTGGGPSAEAAVVAVGSHRRRAFQGCSSRSTAGGDPAARDARLFRGGREAPLIRAALEINLARARLPHGLESPRRSAWELRGGSGGSSARGPPRNCASKDTTLHKDSAANWPALIEPVPFWERALGTWSPMTRRVALALPSRQGVQGRPRSRLG